MPYLLSSIEVLAEKMQGADVEQDLGIWLLDWEENPQCLREILSVGASRGLVPLAQGFQERHVRTVCWVARWATLSRNEEAPLICAVWMSGGVTTGFTSELIWVCNREGFHPVSALVGFVPQMFSLSHDMQSYWTYCIFSLLKKKKHANRETNEPMNEWIIILKMKCVFSAWKDPRAPIP